MVIYVRLNVTVDLLTFSSVVAARRCSLWVMLTRLCSNAKTTWACVHKIKTVSCRNSVGYLRKVWRVLVCPVRMLRNIRHGSITVSSNTIKLQATALFWGNYNYN